MSQPTCSTCRCFLPDDGSETGECHRHAPHPATRLVAADDVEVFTYWPLWPMVRAESFCGEWQPSAVIQTSTIHPIVEVKK
jgi:hypothetical protein